MTTDLRYPIGNFSPPEHIDQEYIHSCIERIAKTPENLQNAVEGLSDAQLDTPYRPGGWTVRQVVHHLPDSHLNSYIRFHWTLTEETPKIKAYFEQRWAELPYLSNLPVATSLELLKSVHQRWVHLLRFMSWEDFERAYIHPEDGLTYPLKKVIGLYAWHGDHHVAHINSLAKRMNW